MRILIIDDDKTNVVILSNFLKPYGLCNLAYNGEEGFALFKKAFDSKDPFDLILIDIMMPNMNGQETLIEIRKYESMHNLTENDYVKIIMTTALSDTDNVMEAFNEKCNAYLVKPIRKMDLESELDKLGFSKK